MDLNLVSSEHSKKVFSEISFEKKNKVSKVVEGKVQLEKPIEVVFEGVNLDLYKHLPSSEVKLNLKGVKEAFNFLFVGHWMQGSVGHDRKNVGLMIRYFIDTYKNKKSSPGLILKASSGRNSYLGREQLLKK